MKDASFEQKVAGGPPLHVHVFLPEDRAIGVLQIIHGMAEHAARYARLAQAFTDAGFAVYAHDQRGHGRTIPRGHAPGHVADSGGFDALVADAHEINRIIANRHPGLPIVLLGHSMGSFVAQALIYTHPRDVVGVILSASDGAPSPIARAGRLLARGERLRLGPLGRSPILRKLGFEDFNRKFAPNRTPSDWLSRDPAEVDKYVCDPLCGFEVDVQFWVDLLDALDGPVHDPENQRKIPRDLPILLVAGDKDPVGDFGKGVRRLHEEYRTAGIRDLSLRLYPGARHEILNETNRDEVTTDILGFAKRVAANA